MTIIQFRPRKTRNELDLNELLALATDLRTGIKNKDDFVTDFKSHISATIMEILIKNQKIEKESFLCGMYISDLLASILKEEPEHWIATDYIMEASDKNPTAIKKGANICFLICSIFQNKIGRCMKVKDYESMGTGLYLHYYHQSCNEIGYYMACNFSIMVEVTKKCINDI